MKALIILEDHTLDRYIAKPVVERILRDLQRSAQIDVVSHPRIRGVNQALSARTVDQVVRLNPMVDLFLIIVDRDCDEQRAAGPLAARLRTVVAGGRIILGCLAIEEIEVWALALHRREIRAQWEHIRSECHPKEVYFQPFIERMGWEQSLGRGRQTAMEALRRQWRALKGRCPEIQVLQDQIRQWLDSRAE
jgi:hypothetical protein